MNKKIVLTLSALMLIGCFQMTTFAKGDVMKEKVFYNQTYNNVKIAGELYKPENFDVNKKYPAIIVVHPAGGVKEQVAGLYAKKLSENGFITLAFDASYQGESGGKPHFLENPASRVEDVRSSVDFLTTLPFVDKENIGVLGICAGGGYAFNAAQTEMRIKAVATVSAFDLDYIDLVYLHQPIGDVEGAWKDLEKAQKDGKVRALGISNFDKDEDLFNSFIKTVKVKPQIMQLECHPYAQRVYWQKKLKENNIAQENWFPLGGRESNGIILKDKTLAKIAKAHKKSVAQVIIRWHLQKGFLVIPGASNPDIKENIEVFDWVLSDKEMDKIEKLNTEKRIFDPPYDKQKEYYLKTILID